MSSYFAFWCHGLSVDSYSLSWSLICLLEWILGFAHRIPRKQKGEQRSTGEFPCPGGQKTCLDSSFLSHDFLADDGLIQNVEMVLGVKTGIQTLFQSYLVLNYIVMCSFCSLFAMVNHRFRGRHQLFTCL